MKRVLIIAPIAIVVLASVVFGFWIEARYSAVLAASDDLGRLGLRSRAYERGLLSSSAELIVDDYASTFSMPFPLRIVHGPLPLGLWIRGEFAPPAMAVLVSEVGFPIPGAEGAVELRVLATIGFDGTVEGHFKMPPLKLEQEGLGRVEFSGLQGEFATTAGDGVLRASLGLPLLRGAAAGFGSVELRGLQSEMNGSYRSLADDGSSSLEIESFRLDVQQGFHLAGLRASQAVTRKGELVEIVGELDVAEAGPPLGPTRLRVVLRNIDAAAANALQDAANSLDALAASERGEMLEHLRPEIARLVEGGPELELEVLEIRTPNGRFDGSGKLMVTAGEGAADLARIYDEPLEFVQGKATFSADRSLAEWLQTSGWLGSLDPWVAQGWIVEEGAKFWARIEVAPEGLLLNGKSLGPPPGAAAPGSEAPAASAPSAATALGPL